MLTLDEIQVPTNTKLVASLLSDALIELKALEPRDNNHLRGAINYLEVVIMKYKSYLEELK